MSLVLNTGTTTAEKKRLWLQRSQSLDVPSYSYSKFVQINTDAL